MDGGFLAVPFGALYLSVVQTNLRSAGLSATREDSSPAEYRTRPEVE